ncbi:class I SAM-dependent methyltransferase [Deinococcus petrolearius]|uniref:Class I SAM-dependent methyltransferase n=1 Tax=Deinococcus petrolearius TaxID=1751295 RepID=A0ABW1DLF2_9DEIO
MHRTYDAVGVQAFYDGYGEREWHRLLTRPSDEVSFHVHRHYLARFVQPEARVLEIGAGPGRFTIELARLGARVTVGDLSLTQLRLNAHFVREADCERGVAARLLLDAVDLSRFPSGSFDVVVCYGGVLSYLFDRAGDALGEMLRVVRPGGEVLLSVMSHLYNLRKRDVLVRLPLLTGDGETDLFGDGDYCGPLADGHEMRLYRFETLEALCAGQGGTVVAASAVNCLSAGNDDALVEVRARPELWARFLAWELREGARRGALDAGHHLLAVVRRNGQA